MPNTMKYKEKKKRKENNNREVNKTAQIKNKKIKRKQENK